MIGGHTRILALAWLIGFVAAFLGGEAPASQPKVEEASAGAAAQNSYHSRMRTAVNEVLAQPEYADLRTDPNAAMKRVMDWIEGLIDAVITPLKHLPEWVLWIIIVWLVLTLLAILAHLVYTLWIAVAGGRSYDRADSRRRHAGQLLGITNLEFDSVYAEAHRLRQAGQWLAATKYFYVAAILLLDRKGLLAFRSSKTNSDYLGELRGRAAIEGPFRQLTGGFEVVVYGGQLPTDATVSSMAVITASLLNEPSKIIQG